MTLDPAPGKLPFLAGKILTIQRGPVVAKRWFVHGIYQPLLEDKVKRVGDRTIPRTSSAYHEQRQVHRQRATLLVYLSDIRKRRLPETNKGQAYHWHLVRFAAHISSTLLVAECHEADTDIDTCLANFDDGNADDSKDGRNSMLFESLRDQLRSADSRSRQRRHSGVVLQVRENVRVCVQSGADMERLCIRIRCSLLSNVSRDRR